MIFSFTSNLFANAKLHIASNRHRQYQQNEQDSRDIASLNTVNPLLSPPGGLFFSSTFEWGLNREGGLKREGGGGLFNLAKRITCSKNTEVTDRVDLRFVQFKVTVKSI